MTLSTFCERKFANTPNNCLLDHSRKTLECYDEMMKGHAEPGGYPVPDNLRFLWGSGFKPPQQNIQKSDSQKGAQ